MKAKQNVIVLAAGIAIGMTIATPATLASEEFFKAYHSSQKFYVDGRKVDLEAYEIGGYNYIKLRDMGKAVGFDVSYDPMTNSAIILTRTPYVDESQPTGTSGSVAIAMERTAQPDPSIFTSALTREVYNGIRDSIIHREEILAGTYDPVPLEGISNPDELAGLGVTLSKYPAYSIRRNDADQIVCLPRYTPAFRTAADHCKPFIDSLAGLTDRDKVRALDFYVCDRMTYAVQRADIGDILSQDGVVPSYCMNYAYCFQFLCGMTDIPCILVRSETHMWNEVYVEGRWWAVDVTGDDAGDDVAYRDYCKVLLTANDLQGRNFLDAQPQITVFAKELLAPGSTVKN